MQADSLELLPIIRHIDNRCCADCSTPLGDFSSVFASVRYGVWLCADCAAIHEVLHSDDTTDSIIKKAQATDWTEAEIASMKQHPSNVAFNSYYERYIPPKWTKCKADSLEADKTLFIKAKYIGKLFFLPPTPSEDIITLKKQEPTASLPSSLMDIFLIMAPHSLANAEATGPITDFRSVEFTDTLFKAESTSHFSSDQKNCKVPENLEAFVYPEDCAVSTLYKSPFFFTIALTDENGRRQFGGVLQVYELVSVKDMERLLGIKQNNTGWPSHWPVFYAVKALVLLSHYPYYNLFREVLEVLYRISLSAAPIPIERYIQHVVTELPLPPQGKIEVAFTMGDRTLTLWRPPKNQLPMIDFSLRPLFTSLCVDSIMLIFGALCTETRTCFCSSNSSLLGPVSESFLSFLFPFVWQGAYIPILPYKLTDILDAPVPFIVGLDRRYLNDTPPQYRPEKVLFVDLDNDQIYYGNEPTPLTKNQCLVTIPDKMKDKLKGKLDDHGGCLHRVDPNMLRSAGDLFMRNDRMVPIKKFATDSGVMYSHHSVVASDGADGSSAAPGARKCYVACSRSSLRVADILDSNNNARSDYATNGDTPSWADNKFDGVEIRGAFLRFFVSAFLDYQDYVKDTALLMMTANPAKTESKRKTFSGFRSKVSNIGSSPVSNSDKRRPSSLSRMDSDEEALRRSIAMNDDGTPRDKSYFDKIHFLKDHPGDFYETLCSTQMFSVFMREQLSCPDQSEIKFFTEAITDKRNRSKKTILKLSTPFLSDQRDAIAKTYVPPYPLRISLSAGDSFSYSLFPDVNIGKLAPTREVPKLVEGPELARLQGPVTKKFKTSILASNAHAKLIVEKEQRQKMEEDVKDSELRFNVLVRGVTRLQACVRMRPSRIIFLRRLEAARIVEKAYLTLLNYRITRVSGAKKYKCSIRIQSMVRGYLQRLHYARLLRAIATINEYKSVFVAVSHRLSKLRKLRMLQLYYRRRFLEQRRRLKRCMHIVLKAVRKFVGLLKYRRRVYAAVTIQCLVRGHMCYVKLRQERYSRLESMREVLIVLWNLDHTKLQHRSNFWVLLGGSSKDCSHFNVKLHELELARLFERLGFFDGLLKKRDSFTSQLKTVIGLCSRQQLASRIAISNPERTRRITAEKEDRQSLYRAMKSETDESARLIYFQKFGIENSKKRKQTLSERVWADNSSAADSAAAVRSILLSGKYEDTQWLQAVRSERLQADVLSVASALLVRVQNKQKRNRRSSLLLLSGRSPSTIKRNKVV